MAKKRLTLAQLKDEIDALIGVVAEHKESLNFVSERTAVLEDKFEGFSNFGTGISSMEKDREIYQLLRGALETYADSDRYQSMADEITTTVINFLYKYLGPYKTDDIDPDLEKRALWLFTHDPAFKGQVDTMCGMIFQIINLHQFNPVRAHQTIDAVDRM
jgi:hypothetical protein